MVLSTCLPNMPSTKKRPRSPEVGGSSSTRESTSIPTHQNGPLKKRRWRGPKDNPIKALQKLERKRRCEVFWDTGYEPITAHAPQLNSRVHRMAPAPVKSPLQRSPGLAVPHSPPSLPEGGDEGEPENFNDSPVSSHIPLGCGLPPASGVRDNHAFFRQTWHLDDHTSTWNGRRNNQATQWKSVAIPRLLPTYLANHAATESGRLLPPKPRHQCQCKTVALKVKMVTWDRKFSPHLLQMFATCVLHQDPRCRYCLPASAIQLSYS